MLSGADPASAALDSPGAVTASAASLFISEEIERSTLLISDRPNQIGQGNESVPSLIRKQTETLQIHKNGYVLN